MADLRQRHLHLLAYHRPRTPRRLRLHPLLWPRQPQAAHRRVPVVVTRNSVLELQAGEAHGVCGGDQFILYPFIPTISASQSQGSSVASRIIRTGALTSQLELLGATSQLELLGVTSIDVRTGWVAEPITRIGLRGFHIRLPLDLPCRDEILCRLADAVACRHPLGSLRA